MLWTPTQQFHPWPFDKEVELESIVRSSLRFPVETLTVERFRPAKGEATR